MKFTVQTILSLPIDGATSHLLLLNNKIKILLDCGISHSFDFTKYSKRANILKTVSLVLISHSSLEYSGAMAFLIDQLGLNPKIFYTTQPIMRYSPLNLHEQIVILRLNQYNKKIFNRIYRLYERINIVKTQQKKAVNVGAAQHNNLVGNQQLAPQVTNQTSMETQEPESGIGEVDKIIYFTGYSAGGNTGSIAWRISFGIVNILYLVEYNNFSLHHINGLDFNQVKQPIDILITDSYQEIDDAKMKKKHLEQTLKQIIVNFYLSNHITPSKPKPITTQQNQPKLLITCYPNQMLIELMAVLKKIIEEMQPPENREKVRVIHLSSRFLQLVKSQIDYFSDFFKESLENMQQFYIHSKTITSRINIVPINALEGLVNDAFTSSNNITVYFLGNKINQKILRMTKEEAKQNLMAYKIMQHEDRIPSSAALPADENEGQNQAMEEEHQHEKDSISEQNQDYTQINRSQRQQIDELLEPDKQFQNFQPLRGKYFSQIGFPQFIKQKREEDHCFDEFGIRHKYQRFEQRKTIEQYNQDMQGVQLPNQPLTKKNSTIQVMNIDFKISEIDKYRYINYQEIKYMELTPHKTNFSSSVHLILGLQPKNVIMINTKQDDQLVTMYKNTIRNFGAPETKFYNLSDKFSTHLQLSNQLISYKLNYIPMPTNTKLQKVRGIIQHKRGAIFIHLECLQQKQCLEFKLHEFYRRIRGSHQDSICKFTLTGIQIDGVKISREEKQIILEGEYSDEYFRVRKMLYEFLGVS